MEVTTQVDCATLSLPRPRHPPQHAPASTQRRRSLSVRARRRTHAARELHGHADPIAPPPNDRALHAPRLRAARSHASVTEAAAGAARTCVRWRRLRSPSAPSARSRRDRAVEWRPPCLKPPSGAPRVGSSQSARGRRVWLAGAFDAYRKPGARADDRPWGAATISGCSRRETWVRHGPALDGPPDLARVGCQAGWWLITEPDGGSTLWSYVS
jgi:hypothetical protein